MRNNGEQVYCEGDCDGVSGAHLDLDHAPYVLYGAKYIDLVALWCEILGSRAVLSASGSHLDLGRAPYALYGAKYIDLVSLAKVALNPKSRSAAKGNATGPVAHTLTWVVRPTFCTGLNI